MSGEAKILGRFNYISFSSKERLFNVIWVPYVGGSCMIIARNLPEQEAKDLIYELNRQIDITYNNIQQSDFGE